MSPFNSARKPPCYHRGADCPRRTPYCHIDCKQYKDFMDANEADRIEAQKDMDADGYTITEVIKNKRK